MAVQRIAIVTGGNRGIGFEICRQLANAGLKVVLTARDEIKGHAASAKLTASGYDVLFHQLDVTRDESIAQFKHYVEAELGRWDVLINNAGVYLDGSASSVNLAPEIFRRTLETNLTGAFILSQSALPLMRKHRYGRIVNVSSGMGDHYGGRIEGCA